jgi:hypothetical protein
MTKRLFMKWCRDSACPACKKPMLYPNVYGLKLGNTVENICHKCYKELWHLLPEKTKIVWGGIYKGFESPVYEIEEEEIEDVDVGSSEEG